MRITLVPFSYDPLFDPVFDDLDLGFCLHNAPAEERLALPCVAEK